MAAPTSLVNITGQKIDTQYDGTGQGLIGFGIDDITIGGITPHAARKGVATHRNGSAVASGEGIMVAGGVFGGNATPILVDSAGRVIFVGAAADGATLAGNPVLMGGSDGTNAQTVLTDGQGNLLTGAGRGTLTDKSGALAAGATSETLMASNAARRYFFIQNVDAAEDLWIDFTTAAVRDKPSIKLGPGQAYENPSHYCSTEAIKVIATTIGHKWTAKEG